MACIFCQIASGQIPSKMLYQDDEIVAFPDNNPTASTHILIVPRKHIPTLFDADEADLSLLGKMAGVARDLAAKEGLKGFRILVNCGAEGGQKVWHLHMHLLGGRRLSDRFE